MNSNSLAALMLRVRLALRGFGPIGCAGAALLLAGAAACAWLLPQGPLQAKRQSVALAQALRPPPLDKPAPVTANENLALFYATLGENRYAEQQVKTLFGLAEKSGLRLSQGEYKGGYERNGRLHTYQVTLPVKGSYPAIWQFSLLALRAIPFASLDEISFKRETIGEPTVVARLRLTLYLSDRPAGAQQ